MSTPAEPPADVPAASAAASPAATAEEGPLRTARDAATVGVVGRTPSLAQAFVPIAVLIALLALSVRLFGDASSSGPNQIALLLAAMAAATIAMRNGAAWSDLERGIAQAVASATGAVLILLMVGALIGSWILAGTVPTMIDYGLSILSPRWFYPAATVICAIVALTTGSSWTTAGTIGVALVGVATAQGLNLGLAAGAVISGAYFGDKLSPLSDTTNLAPAMAGTDLFTHIRHMLWTTIPSIVIALALFTGVGLWLGGAADAPEIARLQAQIGEQFHLGWVTLFPAVLVFALVLRRTPAFPALLLGALAGSVVAVLVQPEAVMRLVGETELSSPMAMARGAWTALFDGYVSETGNAALDDLLTRGGMSSMLNTVWLILCAMTFGAVMEASGMLQRLAAAILGSVRGAGSLVAATVGTAVGMNVIASDQYIAIVLPGRMYRAEFARRGLAPQNLSRALEDGGTITSPLVPWNTCGAFMAGTLGVATTTYLPFAFFNLINPVLAIALAVAGRTIVRLPSGDAPTSAPVTRRAAA